MSKCMITLYKGGTDRINTVVELSAEHNRDVAVNEVLAENGIDGKVKPSSWSKNGIVETAYIGRNRIEVTPYKAYSEVRELVYGKEEMITISEYAEMHGISPATMRQRILRGCHPEAVKIGRDWMIPKDAPYTDSRVGKDKTGAKKTIRMRMTNGLYHELHGVYSRGDLAMGEAEIDLDRLSCAGRFIAEHITATYVNDEAVDMIDVSAESGDSMAERDRKAGRSETYIALMTSGYGDAYATEKLKIDVITFPVYSKRYARPEDVIEETVWELKKAGAKRLFSRGTGEEFIME